MRYNMNKVNKRLLSTKLPTKLNKVRNVELQPECSTRESQMACDRNQPEDSKSVSAMAASLLSETGGVAHILEGQLLFLKPLVAVHGTERLLAGCNQVLVLALTYSHSGYLTEHHQVAVCLQDTG